MTLIEFIKSQVSKDAPMGDLVNDILGDKGFPVAKTEEEIISYLNFVTSRGGTNNTLKKLLRSYRKVKPIVVKMDDLDTNYTILRTENWQYLKSSFPVDAVFLTGASNDYYKVYAVDSLSNKALFFDIKSDRNLNDIRILDEGGINKGNLTKKHELKEAILLLERCPYETPIMPNADNFKELIDFLKTKIK
ncbi:MAG TPA: hypothetical protein DCO83_14580 [Mucilaginibacter sp.]|nr:hypothetical protein [Mucilaginibacter sp.]